MASFPDSAVPVTGYIGVSDPTDTYATHVDILGWGGTMSVETVSDRDAISSARRKFGMLVTVYADPTPANNKTYQLKPIALGGANDVLTNNANWLTFGPSSGTSFQNGITESGGVVKLGGALTGNTDITGAFTLNLGIIGSKLTAIGLNTTNATILNAGTAQLMLNSTSAAKLSGGAAVASIDITTAGALIITDSQAGANQRGLRGAASYIANVQPNDYIQKGYADAKVVGKGISPELASPGGPQNGYAIIWDQTNNIFTLGPSGGGGGVSDGDKGDITVATGGTVWTIDNGVITNGKMANMAAFSLKGNATNVSAAVTDIGIENGLLFSGGKLRFGGTLIATTNLDGAFNFDIGAITPLNQFSAKGIISGIYGTASAAIEVYSNINQSLRLGQTGGAIFNLGSDATGDIYYRTNLGKFNRLGIGTYGQYFMVGLNSLPIWTNTIPVLVGGPTYTFADTDNGKFIYFTTACTANIPTGLPVGWSVTVWRAAGAGLVTFTSSGALSGAGNSLPTEETAATIFHRGSDIHFIAGALTSVVSGNTFDNGLQDVGGGNIQLGGPIITSLTELAAGVNGVGDLYIGTNAAFASTLAQIYIHSTTFSALTSETDAYFAGAVSTNIGDGVGVINLLTPGGNATGDTFYLNASQNLVRRQIGTTNQFYQVVGGIPTWRTATIIDIVQTNAGLAGKSSGGTGALGVITVQNGLSLTGSVLKLGGTLTDSLTSLTGTGANQFNFTTLTLVVTGTTSVVSFGAGVGSIASFSVDVLNSIQFTKQYDNETSSFILFDSNGQISLNSAGGTSVHNNAAFLTFTSQNAYTISGNGNGGGMIFTSGTRRTAGTGIDGKITFNAQGGFEVLSTSTQTLRTFKIDGFNDYIINLGSDAPGDIYYRDAANKFVRLAKTTDGFVLTLASGLPVWAAGGGGGGISNASLDTELPKTNSVGNLISSGIYIGTNGNIQLGKTNTDAVTFRSITTEANGSNIDLRLTPKGTGITQSSSSLYSRDFIGYIDNNFGSQNHSLLIQDGQLVANKVSTTHNLLISGADGQSGSNDGNNLTGRAGNAYGTSGNGNGGNLILNSGLRRSAGSGIDGYIEINAGQNSVRLKGESVSFLQGTGGANGAPYLVIGQRTANPPLTSGANVVLYGEDSTDGTVGLSIYAEQAVEAIGTFTPTFKIKIQYNGTWYWFSADPV